jgi:hypothetical protein
VVIASAILIASSINVLGGQEPVGIRTTLAADNSAVGLFEPVYAIFSVRNNLDQEIRFDLGLNRKAAFDFSVNAESGQVLRPTVTERGPDEGFGTKGTISLSPGATYTQRLLLNEWYDFPAPGSYSIALSSELPFQTATGRLMRAAAPAPISIRIGERNEHRLRDICAALTTKVLTSVASGQAENDAALALSHINDPIAIPFLRQILESGSSAGLVAAEGLSRIGALGHADAIDVLIASLSKADADRKSYIVSALTKTLRTTSDARIKSRIELALSR